MNRKIIVTCAAAFAAIVFAFAPNVASAKGGHGHGHGHAHGHGKHARNDHGNNSHEHNRHERHNSHRHGKHAYAYRHNHNTRQWHRYTRYGYAWAPGYTKYRWHHFSYPSYTYRNYVYPNYTLSRPPVAERSVCKCPAVVDSNGIIVQRAYRGSGCKCQVNNMEPSRLIVPTLGYSTLQPNSKLSDCNACPATPAPNGLRNN